MRPSGSYLSLYVSVGREIGNLVYVTGDYSTSLSVVRYLRTDGLDYVDVSELSAGHRSVTYRERVNAGGVEQRS